MHAIIVEFVVKLTERRPKLSQFAAHQHAGVRRGARRHSQATAKADSGSPSAGPWAESAQSEPSVLTSELKQAFLQVSAHWCLKPFLIFANSFAAGHGLMYIQVGTHRAYKRQIARK